MYLFPSHFPRPNQRRSKNRERERGRGRLGEPTNGAIFSHHSSSDSPSSSSIGEREGAGRVEHDRRERNAAENRYHPTAR